MSPEEYKRLLTMMSRQRRLPQPKKELFKRTSKRFSSVAPHMPSLAQQAKQQEKDSRKK